MGIFGAMLTAVSGLKAQSFALENISGNIANSQTIAFKRNDTTFADLVGAGSDATTQISGSVKAMTRSTNSTEGNGIERSDVTTNMAIKGDGYFILSEKTGESNARPVFGTEDLYTRRGDFAIDRSGYLVNGSGYYLKAIPIDRTTGAPSSSTPQVIQVTNDFLPAKATQTITYRGNIASFPQTKNAVAGVADSELIPATYDFSAGVTADDQSAFLDNSISGGAVTSYDTNGSPVNIQFRWGKISNDTAATPPTSTWNLFYLSNSSATGTGVAWSNTGTSYVFNKAGVLTPPIDTTTVTGVTVNGITIGDVKLDHGGTSLSSYADPNGNASVIMTQDGYAAGEVKSVSVSDGGKIVANYSNGKTLQVAQVQLASFTGQNALAKADGGAFRATIDSGNPILGATGTISGSSTENSNTDIATEFSKLIVTQQAYSANTRIVTTADSMMQETLNMKR